MNPVAVPAASYTRGDLSALRELARDWREAGSALPAAAELGELLDEIEARGKAQQEGAPRARRVLGTVAAGYAFILAGAGVAWLAVTVVSETWSLTPGWLAALSCGVGALCGVASLGARLELTEYMS